MTASGPEINEHPQLVINLSSFPKDILQASVQVNLEQKLNTLREVAKTEKKPCTAALNLSSTALNYSFLASNSYIPPSKT